MKSIIALIAALTIGGLGGWSFGQPTATLQADRPTQTSESVTEDMSKDASSMLLAEDYVSLRPSLAALPNEILSQAESDGLLYMREEEKLARDVYNHLYEVWSLPIFSNIAQSEQTHTEAVRDLLTKYDIADPVTDDTRGVFVNPELQQLYNNLTSKGEVSLTEALKVGALIEDLDINDLTQEIAKTDNQDIILVYENLSRGSRNHLRSFTSQLRSRGETYTPQYITPALYDTIVSATQERGTGGGGGNGRGQNN